MGPSASKRAERATDHGLEIAFFLEGADSALFVVFHVPTGLRGGGVVVCQSILGDFVPNYRREVVVARELAARGVAVARFHYHGCGQSSGSPLEANFGTMCRDSRLVTEQFVDTVGIERVGFLGTRWGALVAAKIAQGHPEAPLALWEPTQSGPQFFREAFRAQKMSAVASRIGVTKKPQDELATKGLVDVLGYSLGRDLYESALGLELVELLAPTAGPLLFVGSGPTDTLTKRDLAVVETLRAGGRKVDARAAVGPEAWWFIDEENATSEEAAAGTTEWLSQHLEFSQ